MNHVYEKRPHTPEAKSRAADPGPHARQGNPTPVAAIAMKHVELAEAFAAREDRFSQLMSKLVRDEYVGDQLLSRSGLSDEEHAELKSLAEGAHASFRHEMVEATSRLRALLSEGDPLYTLSIIQASNMITGWGTYTPDLGHWSVLWQSN